MSAAARYAGRAGGYLREGPGGVNLEKVGTYALLIIGIYVGYKVYKGTKAVSDAAGKALDTARYGATNFLEWLMPLDIGDMLYFGVKFPDGNTHSVGSRQVGKDGTFTFTPASTYKGNPAWKGKRFRLAIDRTITKGTNKFAIPV